jgi:hypothetical protein
MTFEPRTQENLLFDESIYDKHLLTIKEAETTKHIHRLHPYKGKFIPQLVEYFLDDHTDSFKKAISYSIRFPVAAQQWRKHRNWEYSPSALTFLNLTQ